MRPIVTYIPRGVVPRTAHLLLHGVVRGAARSGAAYFYTQPSAAWRGLRPIVTYISQDHHGYTLCQATATKRFYV